MLFSSVTAIQFCFIWFLYLIRLFQKLKNMLQVVVFIFSPQPFFFSPCLQQLWKLMFVEHVVACVDSSPISFQAANKHCSEKKLVHYMH